MKSLILASGFGTRLYPLTITEAKCLLPYKGKPIISHVVDKIPQDIDILVNTNKKFEADFRRWQNTLSREITLCTEPIFSEEQSWGAIGSIDYWARNKNIIDDLLIVAGDKSKATQFGVVKLDGNRIVEFDEKPAVPKSSLIATACWIVPPRIFPILSEFCSEGKKDNLGSFIAYLISRDEVYAYTFSELWLDIGSVDAYRSTQ